MSIKGNALMYLRSKGKRNLVTRLIKNTRNFGEYKNIAEINMLFIHLKN
jgi:hypothetical protein